MGETDRLRRGAWGAGLLEASINARYFFGDSRVGNVFETPFAEGANDRQEFAAFGGQGVVVADRVCLVRRPLDNSQGFQTLEALGQDDFCLQIRIF